MTRNGERIYLEISIASTESQREILIPDLEQLGCLGFQDTDNALICYFDKSGWDATRYDRFLSLLKQTLESFSINPEFGIKVVRERNWNEDWEKTLTPIEVGDRFVIRPSWTKPGDRSGKIDLLIDPKMSFGTGYHESTRLILALLEHHLIKGDRLLDVGTGTGILAIAGIKLGARSAIGNDIDAWAIDNARENIILNDVGQNIDITENGLESFPSSGFDIICANIMSSTILQMLPELRRIAQPGARLLLSGLLRTERDTIVAALQSYGFIPIEERTENEWIAIAAKKQPESHQ